MSPTTPVEMVCPSCGTEVRSGMTRCRRCGHQLRGGSEAASGPVTVTPPSNPTPPSPHGGDGMMDMLSAAPAAAPTSGQPAPYDPRAASRPTPPPASPDDTREQPAYDPRRAGAEINQPTPPPLPPNPPPTAPPSPPTGYAPELARDSWVDESTDAGTSRKTPLPPPSLLAAASASGRIPRPEESDDSGVTPNEGSSNFIRLQCKHCQNRIRIKPSRAGSRVKCPKCSKAIAVPNPSVDGADGPASDRGPIDPKKYAKLAAKLPEQPRTAGGETPAPANTLSNRAFKKIAAEIANREPGKNESHTEMITRRQKAIDQLGESRDGRAREVLVAQFEDPSPAIRRSVIQSLGTVGDARAVPDLVAMLDDDDPEIRRETVNSLGKLADRRAVRPLMELSLDDPRLKFPVHGAVTSMGEVATPELLDLLNGRDDGTVLEAIVLLGRLRDPKALKALVSVIDSRSSMFRIHAAEALGQIGDERAVSTLTHLLQDDDPGLRVAAASALGRMPNSADAKALVRALRDPDADVRRLVAEALGEVGDKRAGDALAKLLADPDERCRLAATEALGKIGDNRALEPLFELLDSDDENVLLQAIGSFRRLRDPRAVEKLVDFLYHERTIVRQRTVEALGNVGDALAAERIEGVLKQDRAPEVRIAAAKALGEIRDPGSLDALEQALQDEFQVRCRAIVSLGRIGDEQCLPALLAMLKDAAPEVRFQATGAIADLGATRAAASLEELLDDENAMVRRGAAKALIKLGDERGDQLLEIAAKPRKKKKRRKSASRSGPMFDLSSLRNLSPMELLAGLATPRGKFVGGVILLVPVLFFVAMLVPKGTPDVVVRRGKFASMNFTPSGEQLFVGRSLGLVEIWNTNGGRLASSRQVDLTQPIRDIVPAPDGKAFVARVGEKIVHVGTEGEAAPADLGLKEAEKLVGSPDSTFCAALAGAVVSVFDTATGSPKGALQLGGKTGAIAVDSTGQWIAAGRASGFTEYNLLSPADQVNYTGPKLLALGYAPEGDHIAAIAENEVLLWSKGTGTVQSRVELPNRAVEGCIAFSNTKPGVVLVLASGAIYEWDPAAGTLTPTDASGPSAAFAAGFIATGDGDESAVRLLNLAEGDKPKKLDVVTHDPLRKDGWLW